MPTLYMLCTGFEVASYPGHPMFFNVATLKNMGWPGYAASFEVQEISLDVAFAIPREFFNTLYDIVIVHSLAPTASPTTIEAHKFNSTSVFLSWRPPLAQYWNGIIQGYHVNFTQANRTNSDSEEYTTVVPYLLINNLEPGVMYTFRVAAYTVGGKGPFSELMDIVPSLNFCGMSEHMHQYIQ